MRSGFTRGLIVSLAIGSMAAACAPIRQASASGGGPSTPATSRLSGADDETAYMCPMHPDYTQEKPGTCPRCGMALVVGTPFDMRNYRLDVRTVPTLIKPGEKVTLQFSVLHPGTGQSVKTFEPVHEKLYHLFVISQDMEFFEHIHPDQQPDGTWSVGLTLPRAGHYKIFSDFVPAGGSAQFLAYPLATAGYSGDVFADTARLVPDTAASKTVGDLTATVRYDPTPMVAALHGHMTFHLTRAGSDEAVTDLQTYLGAFGHMLIVSEDTVDYVHSHQLDMLPSDANLDTLRGGPDVIFEGLMPKPGRYRAWAQFRYHDTVHTFPFTFEVRDLGGRS